MASYQTGTRPPGSTGIGFDQFDEAFPWWDAQHWRWEVNVDNNIKPLWVWNPVKRCEELCHMAGDREVNIQLDMPGATEAQYDAVMEWLLRLTGYYPKVEPEALPIGQRRIK